MTIPQLVPKGQYYVQVVDGWGNVSKNVHGYRFGTLSLIVIDPPYIRDPYLVSTPSVGAHLFYSYCLDFAPGIHHASKFDLPTPDGRNMWHQEDFIPIKGRCYMARVRIRLVTDQMYNVVDLLERVS